MPEDLQIQITILAGQIWTLLYGCQTKPLNAVDTIACKGILEIEKKKRIFLKKMLGPRKVSANQIYFIFYLWTNQQLYEESEITDGTKQRGLKTGGTLNKIIIFQENGKIQLP